MRWAYVTYPRLESRALSAVDARRNGRVAHRAAAAAVGDWPADTCPHTHVTRVLTRVPTHGTCPLVPILPARPTGSEPQRNRSHTEDLSHVPYLMTTGSDPQLPPLETGHRHETRMRGRGEPRQD